MSPKGSEFIQVTTKSFGQEGLTLIVGTDMGTTERMGVVSGCGLLPCSDSPSLGVILETLVDGVPWPERVTETTPTEYRE